MTLTLRKPVDATPKRLAALAKLPVFFDLASRRTVVAGGTAAAAWKAELLAAAGAHVEIYADTPSPEMAELIVRGAAAGSLHHHSRPWDVACLRGAAMAVADAGTDAQARTFFCAAVAAGVPVNVIDKPTYCDFQFGAIVNRSPIVIGISTDGAAPILGQAIRRRIETLLPTFLADWGRLAQSMRSRVAECLSPGAARRAFWEHLSDLAFRRAVGADDQQSLRKHLGDLADGEGHAAGRVTLVGAGPGDAELLTLKAVRALQSADVILFDDLISDDVLELARREAKRILVGKRGGRDSCRQEDINDLMVKLAHQGRHVVRLKSGDPMVFGRAGEEIDRLDAEGITVDVVPGITAGSALASAMRRSLTHRDHSHSVRFVTGHSKAGQLPDDLDWRGLADPDTTLVFYMGGRTAPAIAERLIGEGMSPQTPVVVAVSVSRPDMRLTTTTLDDMRRTCWTDHTTGPVLIAIGRCLAGRQSCGADIASSDVRIAAAS